MSPQLKLRDYETFEHWWSSRVKGRPISKQQKSKLTVKFMSYDKTTVIPWVIQLQ